MNKKISIILNILIIILLTTVAYGWMQTEPSVGELVEYEKEFYITDSDIDVKLFTLVDNTYIEQSQFPNDEVISIDNAYPGKIQRYRFELTNTKQTPARVKIVFTNIGGEIHLTKNYYIINGTNPDTFTFRVGQKLQYNTENDRYFFNLSNSVEIPANTTINYYWNIQIDIDAPNALQGTTFSVGKIMFIKP